MQVAMAPAVRYNMPAAGETRTVGGGAVETIPGESLIQMTGKPGRLQQNSGAVRMLHEGLENNVRAPALYTSVEPLTAS